MNNNFFSVKSQTLTLLSIEAVTILSSSTKAHETIAILCPFSTLEASNWSKIVPSFAS